METTVSQIMQADVLSVSMDDSLEKVSAFFRSHHVSAAPVAAEGGGALGIITLHDLEQAEARGKDMNATRAWETCTYKPLAVPPDTTLRVAASLMVEQHMHHLLVKEGGQLKGILSSLDFVRLFLSRSDAAQ